MLALRTFVSDIGNETALYKEMKNIPNDRVRNFRNDMYLVSEALRLMKKSGQPAISADDTAILANYKKHIDHATRFIPRWVKVAVAMALGLGTMVGWKRIVVTVGEKIGKSHLTYAQGAVAEITAMATIGAADGFGLPVSTTHVLSSGVAGTMAANKSGIQWSTVRNLAWRGCSRCPYPCCSRDRYSGSSARRSEESFILESVERAPPSANCVQSVSRGGDNTRAIRLTAPVEAMASPRCLRNSTRNESAERAL